MKSPSLDALYDVFAVDWYKSPKKVDCITDVVHVPSISDALMMLKNSTRPDIDVATAARELTALAADANCPFPPIFVLNMAAPTYAPANPLWGKAVEDGPSVSLILYLLLNEHGRAAIQKRSPAGRLLQVRSCFPDVACSSILVAKWLVICGSDSWTSVLKTAKWQIDSKVFYAWRIMNIYPSPAL